MKQRKASTKCLSILLVVSMLLSGICIPIAAADTESGISTNDLSLNADTSVSSLTSADLPETMTLASAMSAGHVRRLRDEEPDLYTVVFENADGTNTAYIFSEPVKYDDNGVIRDKSTSIFAVASSDALPSAIGNASSYAYKTTNNDVKVYFGTSSSQGVSLTYQEYTIRSYPETSGGGASTYALPQQASGVLSTTAIGYASENAKNALQYASGVGRGSVLEYIPTLNGLKENIVLSSFTGQSEFTFRYETNGLALRESDGEVQFIDPETEEVVGRFAPIISYGADGERSLGSLTVTPIVENQTYRVTVNVDEQFLRDAAYPVTVDPTVTMGKSYLRDLTLYNGYDEEYVSSIEAETYLGTDSSMGGQFRVLYGLSSMGSTMISTYAVQEWVQVSLCLQMCATEGVTVTASPYTSTTWTTNGTADYCSASSAAWQSGNDTVTDVTEIGTTSYTFSEYAIDITDSFNYWKNNTTTSATQYNIMLKNTHETGAGYDDKDVTIKTLEGGGTPYIKVYYGAAPTGLYYLENLTKTPDNKELYLDYSVKSGVSPTLCGDEFAITAGQRWEISMTTAGYYTIRTRYYGNASNPYHYESYYLSWSQSSSGAITISTSLSPAYWQFTKAANNTYTISPLNKSSYYLALGAYNGALCTVLCKTGTETTDTARRWTLKKTAFSVGGEFYDSEKYSGHTLHDDINIWLDAAGYKTIVLTNPSKVELEAAIFAFDSEIVYFSTHGRQNEVSIKNGAHDTDPTLPTDTFIVPSPDTRGERPESECIYLSDITFSHTKLVMYDACLTASTLAGPSNLCSATLDRGAESVIGWEERTWTQDTIFWQSYFWSYVFNGATLKEAAHFSNLHPYRDALETILDWHIYGNSNLELFPSGYCDSLVPSTFDTGTNFAAHVYVGTMARSTATSPYASADDLEQFIYETFDIDITNLSDEMSDTFVTIWCPTQGQLQDYTVHILEYNGVGEFGDPIYTKRSLSLSILDGVLVAYNIFPAIEQ